MGEYLGVLAPVVSGNGDKKQENRLFSIFGRTYLIRGRQGRMLVEINVTDKSKETWMV